MVFNLGSIIGPLDQEPTLPLSGSEELKEIGFKVKFYIQFALIDTQTCIQYEMSQLIIWHLKIMVNPKLNIRLDQF